MLLVFPDLPPKIFRKTKRKDGTEMLLRGTAFWEIIVALGILGLIPTCLIV